MGSIFLGGQPRTPTSQGAGLHRPPNFGAHTYAEMAWPTYSDRCQSSLRGTGLPELNKLTYLLSDEIWCGNTKWGVACSWGGGVVSCASIPRG